MRWSSLSRPGGARRPKLSEGPASLLGMTTSPMLDPTPDAAAARADALGLSELALAILDFEGRWWQTPEAKDRQIRETFDLTAVRYYQLLNRLIDLPTAREAAPLVVLRLRRLRARRAHGPAARLG
ncbi:hypothetical protein GCM10011519_08180 [Marmoricola endophyticus]|uniref:DUF3263 domain-containing protein n=2 Tax=Marmoricola endophyticus TaxID=2040280 RepID=A0A917BCR8_9ACTN|nr:hypothetical protein GCM10011519_08180 [Marmoricola endophyticus]